LVEGKNSSLGKSWCSKVLTGWKTFGSKLYFVYDGDISYIACDGVSYLKKDCLAVLPGW
jgi:hypothetical protein